MVVSPEELTNRTFSTTPRVAQELMRSSHIRLTMQVYTGPKPFDLETAVESFRVRAPSVAQTRDGSGETESSSVNQPRCSGIGLVLRVLHPVCTQ